MGFRMDLADVLGHYSDTAIFSMYVSFQLSQGKSLESVLCGVFQPNDHAYVTGFVAEGPATMMIGYHMIFTLLMTHRHNGQLIWMLLKIRTAILLRTVLGQLVT